MAEKVKGLFGGMKKGHHEEIPDSTVGSGVGHTPESSPYGTNVTDAEYKGQQSLDPTGPDTAGGAGFRNDDIARDERPEFAGTTNDQGGAALTDENGNLKPGPHQDAVKREGIFSKIKDKMHGSK